MKGIADTGFIVAFGNHGDSHHVWALNLARAITEPLLTCEAVLAEAAFHLGSSAYVLSLVQDEMLRVAFDCGRNLEQLRGLARRYQDRKPDFADLCLIRMSELYPRHAVITAGEGDFRIFRRNKREIIPTICPPSCITLHHIKFPQCIPPLLCRQGSPGLCRLVRKIQ
jgi:predicted nucleic acid-binding protein